MKRINRFLVLLSVAAFIAASFAITSCKEPGESMSVSERMEAFKNDVNNLDYLALKQHTHPDATQYALAGTAAVWNTYFYDNTFVITSISGTTANVTCHGVNYTFSLKEDGDDNYKIYEVVRNSDSHVIFD